MPKIRVVLNNRDGITNKGGLKRNKRNGKKSAKVLKELLELMKTDTSMRNCKGFMHNRLENIVLVDDKSNTYMKLKGRLSKRRLSKIASRLDNAHVLINSGGNNYRKIPYKSYKALCKIRYIVVNISISISEDWGDGDEPYVAYSGSYNISSLNQLFSFINERKGLINGLNRFHAGDGWYSQTEIKETASVLYKKKSAYKIKFDKFLEKYDLY